MTVLNLVDSFITRHLIQAERRHKFTWAMIGAFIFAVFTVFVALQTEWCVRRFKRPGGVDGIKHDMAADREVQNQRRAQYIADNKGEEPAHGIVFDTFFNAKEQEQLKAAKDFLLNDERLQNDLEQSFGASFANLDAVVIPAGQMHYMNSERLGITDESWKDADDHAAWKFSVCGLTMRDRAGGPQATFDGRPRIALHPWSFRSTQILRRALFHEMLHALNVPGYTPLCVTRQTQDARVEYCLVLAQNDLVYLPEYRNFLKQAQLYDGFHEDWIWFVFSILLILLLRSIHQIFFWY